MNPAFDRLRKPRRTRWPPPARRLAACLAVAMALTLAVPADAQQASGSTYGPVQRADTLWELALRFRGDLQVNAQQVMIAILRANPEAFVDGNVNALRTGVTLRVPSAADMTAITPGEAAAEFARHEEAWRNRRRTGSAAPAPGPSPSPRPAPQPAEAPAPADEAVAEELRKARATVAELRDRLSERDEAIEDLLVQLAAARRELRAALGTAPAPSGGATGEEAVPAGQDESSRASWLPVSPLILGSSLIVLLVLIVVVTLLRQRGGPEDSRVEEPFEEDGEGTYEEGEEGDPYEPADGRAEPYAPASGRRGLRGSGMEASGDASREAESARPDRAPALPAAFVAAAGAVPEHGSTGDGAAPDREEDESADLPIGMDLEGEEDWDAAAEESSRDHPERDDPGSPSGPRPHVELGKLDDLDLDVGPGSGSFSDLPADLGETDDPPGGTGPARPAPGRWE